MISKANLVTWVNTVSNCHNSVLSHLSSDMIFEHHMEFSRAPFFPIKNLMPLNLILKATQKQSQVLRDKVVRQVVSFKPQSPKSANQQSSIWSKPIATCHLGFASGPRTFSRRGSPSKSFSSLISNGWG